MLQTKVQLANSLKDLMRKTPFHKITIQNVTDHCGLNRQTFYYHFRDMYDLLDWIYRHEIFPQDGADLNWRNILLNAVEYARKNKAFLRNLNRSLRRETIEKFLYPDFCRWVTLLFDSACGDSGVRQGDRAFLIGFLTSAFLSFAVQWIGEGMPYDGTYLLGRAQLIYEMIRQTENPDCQSGRTGRTEPAFQLMRTVRAAGQDFL